MQQEAAVHTGSVTIGSVTIIVRDWLKFTEHLHHFYT